MTSTQFLTKNGEITKFPNHQFTHDSALPEGEKVNAPHALSLGGEDGGGVIVPRWSGSGDGMYNLYLSPLGMNRPGWERK